MSGQGLGDRRVVVITGAASGIGYATACRFADSGANLVLVDRDPGVSERAESLGAKSGVRVLARHSDVGEPQAVDADIAAVRQAFGRVDVLVTCAGWSVGGNALSTTVEEWRQVFRINVEGTWLWVRAVLPLMQAQKKGCIVTVASQLALAGARNNSAYVASKGAVISLTRTLALDHATEGIRVNAVAPGAIETPMLERAFIRRGDPAVARARSEARHAMGRVGQPDEIAAAVEFLASDAASFITGTVLPVEGGWLVA
mgnify:CR=1 FL=1